jgi:hypothetical protein
MKMVVDAEELSEQTVQRSYWSKQSRSIHIALQPQPLCRFVGAPGGCQHIIICGMQNVKPFNYHCCFACRRYALVSQEDGQQVVDAEELMDHTLALHEGLGHGDVVEVLDTWCDRSYPGSILSSSAFTKVNQMHVSAGCVSNSCKSMWCCLGMTAATPPASYPSKLSSACGAVIGVGPLVVPWVGW